ncbi:hypothetical protein EHQ81_10845 [Leptospira selangorensis]|uniref:TIGR04388 family protein n=1 Tax=Leptospira selangorensis TaxID=2484982 RepID=A0A5F2C383_9LEPT|nr:hypothetical protein EHQ81_10845 [Leptospira selangorensis]TGM22329.1 hypothetical protein EHQ82_07880 [Leptospira selangorensis]
MFFRMRHNFLAQFLLIAFLALGSSSAFAEEVSDSEYSSQNMSGAEESISEELKSIYQEEVDLVLAEGISYSEEERLSDFPDLDSLLADEGVPTRVAKISEDKKVKKGNDPNSELKIQNRKSTSEIFSVSSPLSQNCLLGLNVLLSDLKVGRGFSQEFLPWAQVQGRTQDNEASPVRGFSYANFLSDCAGMFSLNLSGEGFATGLVCSAENQRNHLLGSGVPTTGAANLRKTAENPLGPELNLRSGQIQGIAQVPGGSYENRTFSWAILRYRVEIGESALVSIGRQMGSGSSLVKQEALAHNQELKSSLEKVASKVGQDSYKFSSGRPTPEILT